MYLTEVSYNSSRDHGYRLAPFVYTLFSFSIMPWPVLIRSGYKVNINFNKKPIQNRFAYWAVRIIPWTVLNFNRLMFIWIGLEWGLQIRNSVIFPPYFLDFKRHFFPISLQRVWKDKWNRILPSLSIRTMVSTKHSLSPHSLPCEEQ